MKRIFTVLILGLIWFSSVAQITFEHGYFIDNDNNRIECFIKNVDWKDNPINFEYKKSEQSEAITINIAQAREFGINNIVKYARANVKIDRSGNKLAELSWNRDPAWSEEQLYLEVLMEAKASLYSYNDGSLVRFFYKIDDSPVHQLIYKEYRKDNAVATNSDFRNQLWNTVRCKDAELSSVENLSFNKKDLTKYFKNYNECNGEVIDVIRTSKNKNFIHLRITPGLENSGLKIWNADRRYGVATFDQQVTFRTGLQAEFILPYNKNKWGLMVEPTFQYFNSKKSMSSAAGDVTIQYKSIEVPVGVRHYFFITDKSKVFLNALFVMDITFDSYVKFKNDPTFKDVNPRLSGAFGAGYDLNKLSIEVRYFMDRRIMGDYVNWRSHYEKVSLILGYRIF